VRISGSGVIGLIYSTAVMLLSPAAQAGWMLQENTAQGNGCTLETAEITMEDGYQETRVRLNINADRLLVITKSNIDTSFGDTALQVDNRDAIRPDTVVDEQNVIFASGIDTIVTQFRKGNSVSIHLRFWPTYPETQQYKAVFSLIGFTRAWNEYQQCRK
jgi:hypothetical protein